MRNKIKKYTMNQRLSVLEKVVLSMKVQQDEIIKHLSNVKEKLKCNFIWWLTRLSLYLSIEQLKKHRTINQAR